MELDSRFSSEKWAHYELCCLISEVVTKQGSNNVSQLFEILSSKWAHFPAAGNLESELKHWKDYCRKRNHWLDYCLKMHILYFLQTSELLCILAVLPLGSCEAEHFLLFKANSYVASINHDRGATMKSGSCSYTWVRFPVAALGYFSYSWVQFLAALFFHFQQAY